MIGWRVPVLRVVLPALAGLMAALAAAAALPAQASDPAAGAPTDVLVRYSFDDGNLATGPDTFAVFEKAKGRVHLTTTYRYSGYRSVQIRDVPDDGNFPELQGYFPLRESGVLYAHFALLLTDPAEQLNIALAGPGWFTLKKGGIAFWLQTRSGSLFHYSDSIPMRLIPLRAFVWYLVDVAYDVGRGAYDLTIREENRAEPLVRLRDQPNVTATPGSGVDKFSFIGDNGHDTSAVEYFVDDVVLTVDRPIPIGPFVAPGRRKLFFDAWSEGVRTLRSKPACLPPIDLFADFGLTAESAEGLERSGLLRLLEALVNRPQAPGLIAVNAPGGSARVLEAIRLWSEGCEALRSGAGETALERFAGAARLAPGGRIYTLSSVLALAALGRFTEADVRLAGVAGEWRDDPRWPLALAMLGLARGDFASAEDPLRPRAARVPDDPRFECLLAAHSGRLDADLVAMLKARFPDDWATCLDALLLPEQYFHVLLLRRSAAEAERYALRMIDRLRALGLPPGPWIERAGDAAFLAGDHSRARDRYEESGREGGWGTPPLKMSDVAFLLGDLEGERHYREAIYGSLHEDPEHREEAPPAGVRPERPVPARPDSPPPEAAPVPPEAAPAPPAADDTPADEDHPPHPGEEEADEDPGEPMDHEEYVEDDGT